MLYCRRKEKNVSKKNCDHKNAEFYAEEHFDRRKSTNLYNCPDCGSTITEETLRERRKEEEKE